MLTIKEVFPAGTIAFPYMCHSRRLRRHDQRQKLSTGYDTWICSGRIPEKRRNTVWPWASRYFFGEGVT